MSSITAKKIPERNILLTLKSGKWEGNIIFFAHSIVLSAESSLLPDYARFRHTQAPQSMPHAMLPLCKHLHDLLGSLCPVKISHIHHPESPGLVLQMDKTVSNPPCSHQKYKEFVFGRTVISTATRRNEI